MKKQTILASEPYSQHQVLTVHKRDRRATKPSFLTKPQGWKGLERAQYFRRDSPDEPVPNAALLPRRRLEDTAKHWYSRSRKASYRSKEELNSDESEQEELLPMMRPRLETEAVQAGKRHRKVQQRPDRHIQVRREAEVPFVDEEDNERESRCTPPPPIKASSLVTAQPRAAEKKNMIDFATGLIIGAPEAEDAVQRRKERYKQELLEQIAEQRRNKQKEKELELRVAATGATDPEKATDRLKEFGAVRKVQEGRRQDVPYIPRMGLDSLGVDIDKRTEHVDREPPERPRAAFKSPILEYSTTRRHLGNTGGGNDHKDLLRNIGDMVAPRVAQVPPPRAPTLSEGYSTPYDEAYYYYGARNPLDPSLSYYGPPTMQRYSPSQRTYLPARTLPSVSQPPAGDFAQPASQHSIPLPKTGIGAHPSDRHKFPKERPVTYQEALKQQIDEMKERRRREKEEKKLSDTKIMAEMKVYDPWGKGGGGAPLKDTQGNLICDLKHMHRVNEEAYLNPESARRKATSAVASTEATPRGDDKDPFLYTASDDKVSSLTQTSQFARRNVFQEPVPPQKLNELERYRESLKQQIEEKRRLEAEKKERLRLEDEMGEKKVAEERARLQKEYEEDQIKLKEKARKAEQAREAVQRSMADKQKAREEKAREKKTSNQLYEQEKQARLEQELRCVSPPVPTLQNRLTQQIPPRPRSVDNQWSTTNFSQNEQWTRDAEKKRMDDEEKARENKALKLLYEEEKQAHLEQELRCVSPPVPTLKRHILPRLPSVNSQRSTTSLTVRSISPPSSRDPVQKNQIRAAEQKQSVIRELSVLRQHLKNEQKQLQGQLLQSNKEDKQTLLKNRKQPLLNAFDIAMLRMQRPPSNTIPPNKQNIEEFTQLKYRDSKSREKVRQMYPEPPTDESSLEIQQQALLQEQQRRLNNMQRARSIDYFDLSSPMEPASHWSDRCAKERNTLLESESAFIDANGNSFPITPHPDRLSARDRRRSSRRTVVSDGVETPSGGRISYPLDSADSFQLDRVRELNQRRMRMLDDMSEKDHRSREISTEDENDLWQQTPSPSPTRRISTTTVATEAWLRPGTTETLKERLAGQRPSSRDLPRHKGVTLSTYHG